MIGASHGKGILWSRVRPSGRSPGQPAILLALILGVSACGGLAVELPAGSELENFVTVTVRPTGSQKGGSLAIPVTCDEVKVFKRSVRTGQGQLFIACDEAKYDQLKPNGFTWSYVDGIGRLVRENDQRPTRIFVLTAPSSYSYKLGRVLGAMATDCFEPESPNLGAQPCLREAMTAMALAVVGVKPQGLSSMFPLPFPEAPPVLGGSIELLALTVNRPDPIGMNTPYKIDGAAGALVREMIQKKVMPAPDSTVWESTNLIASLNAESTCKLVMDAIPSPTDKVYAARWAQGASADEIVSQQLEALIRTASSSSLSFKLYAGNVPTPGPVQIDAGGRLASPLSPSSAGKDFLVSFTPNSRTGLKMVDFDAVTGPLCDGTGRVQIVLSARAAASFSSLLLVLREQLLRAWQWKKLLEQTQSGAVPDPAVQTLMRLTRPMWEWWVLKTLEGKQVNDNLGDLLDSELAARRLRDAGSVASSFQRSINRISLGESTGEPGVFVGQDRRDIEMSILLKKGLSTKAPKAADMRLLAGQLSDLLTTGFTRPQRTVALRGLCEDAQGQTTAPVQFTYEPDLKWLARATSAGVSPTNPAADNVLTHPLGVLGGSCRVGAILASASMPTTVSFAFAGCTTESLPETPPLTSATHIYLTTDTWAGLRGELLRGQKLCDGMEKASENMRGYLLMKTGTPGAADMKTWLECSSSELTCPTSFFGIRATPVVTAGDQAFFYYYFLTERIGRHAAEVDKLFRAPTTTATAATAQSSSVLPVAEWPMFTWAWTPEGDPVSPPGGLLESPQNAGQRLHNAKQRIYLALLDAAELQYRWEVYLQATGQAGAEGNGAVTASPPDKTTVKRAFYRQFRFGKTWDGLLKKAWDRLLLSEPMILPDGGNERSQLVNLAVTAFRRELQWLQHKLNHAQDPDFGDETPPVTQL